MFDKIFQALGKVRSIGRAKMLIDAEKYDVDQEAACRDEIQKKRTRALERKERTDEAIKKTGGPVLTDWEKDDVYADEKFYNKKVVECHQKNSRFGRARGW